MITQKKVRQTYNVIIYQYVKVACLEMFNDGSEILSQGHYHTFYSE